MKKILILGGSGFIGKNLVEYFSQKNDVYEVVAPTHHALDLLDTAQVKTFFTNQYFDAVLFARSEPFSI